MSILTSVWSAQHPNAGQNIQQILTSRQVNFQILRNNVRKIGLTTTTNKIYNLNNAIRLDRLNLGFVHFKKLAKIQFQKYGKT